MPVSVNFWLRGVPWPLLVSMLWLTSCGDSGSNPPPPAPPGFQETTLHFDLDDDGFLHPDEEYWLHVAGERVVMETHSDESLAGYLEDGGSPTNDPTHFATVDLPTDRTMLLYVTQRSDDNGALAAAHGDGTEHGLALPIVHIPAAARAAVPPRTAQQAAGAQTSSGSCIFKTGNTGEVTEALLNTYSPCDVAKTLIFLHPELLNFDTTNAATVMSHLEAAPGLNSLANEIGSLGQHGWYTLEPILNTDGTQFINSREEPVFQYVVNDAVRGAAITVLQNTLNATKNDANLAGVSYNVIEGTTSIDQSADAGGSSLGFAGQIATNGTQFKISHAGPQPGLETTVVSADNQDVTLEFTNHYIRHLSAYVEFYDENDVPIPNPDLNCCDPILSTPPETETIKFLTLINPVSTFMSIPVFPDVEQITFTMPEAARYAKLYAGGLGHGGERINTVERAGVALTVMFELGIPAFLLASTAALPNLGETLRKFYLARSIIDATDLLFFEKVWSTGDKTFARVLSQAVIFIGNALVQIGFQFVIDLLAEAIAEEAAEDALPFVGWIMVAVNIATTASELAQTSAEVASSPWVIENRMNVIHDIAVTIDHDPNDFEFPATATHYTVTAQFSAHDTRVITQALPGTTVSDPIVVNFTAVPSGGTVNLVVGFYSDNDVLVGRAPCTTGDCTAEQGVGVDVTNVTPAGDSALNVSMTIKEELVALDANSVYSHKQKLTYTGGAHEWIASGAPTQTLVDLDASESGNALSALVDIAISQKVGALGYAWRSFSASVDDCDVPTATGQLYTYQVISATENPETGLKFSGCGTLAQPYISLELLGAADGTGNNFVLEPNPDGFFYVRHFVLNDSGSFSLGNTSYGRFPVPLDSAVLHPNGFILGINRATSKIYAVKLSATAVADSAAPKATQYSGPAISRAGAAANANLLVNPVAMALGLDGQLIILETIRNLTAGTPDSVMQGRLRAFGKFGHPIKFFFGKTAFGAALASETDPVTYLDVGIESKGYIYVLSYINDGDVIDDYHLDIYNPDGSFLVRTTGANAARMTVDLWRNVYTLNYETIVGPNGRTEPSVSQWIPPVPAASATAASADGS